MKGWIVPPPKNPAKSKEAFQEERVRKVRQLMKQGYLRSDRIKQAVLKVSREDFIPANYKDYAYLEVPLPLPGKEATVSCPHSYPLFYEPLGLDRGQKFLEVGLGSGYGAGHQEVAAADGIEVRFIRKEGGDAILLINGCGHVCLDEEGLCSGGTIPCFSVQGSMIGHQPVDERQLPRLLYEKLEASLL